MERKQHLLRSALFYAEKMGWPVFPCKPRDKNPLTEHGFKDATTDVEQIEAWWKQWPQANIGVPTGVKFWVLDIDPRNGGDVTLEALIAKHGPLPDTVQAMTGGGGRHYLFALPNGFTVKNGELGEGIDIKGKGGYILVAPSIHPSGRAYVWDGAEKITEQTILPAPGWLLMEIYAAQNGHGGANPAVLPPTIPKGKQHRMLVSLAGSMRKRGAEFPEIFAALVAMNPRLEEPAPEEHLRKMAKSVCKYPPDKLLLEEEPAGARSETPETKDEDVPQAVEREAVYSWPARGAS